MTLAELIADSKDRIAEGSDTFFQDHTWKRWLNEAQRYVVRRTRVLERSAYTMTVPGQQSYALEKDFWVIHFVTLGRNTLLPLPTNSLVKRGDSAGTPTHYSIWSNAIYLHPTPVSEDRLTVLYYAWPSPMERDEDTPEIPEAFHGLLPTFAAYRAKMADQQTAEAQSLFLEFQQGLDELVASYTDVQDQVSRVRDVTGDGLWL